MAKFYYGLDTSKYLGQLENTREALINLGLNPDDLDVVRGLSSANVSRSDIKNISNLDIDFKDELVKIYYGTSNYSYFIQGQKTIIDDVLGNIQMNSQLGASAIKYKYINFQNSTVNIADISTSRVSSWSSFASPVTETSPIFYGGKVTVTADATNVSKLLIDGIHKTSPLKKRRFASEVPTHKVKMTINGSDMEFYAMRGIPVSFEAFYKNASIRLRTSTTTPSGYPTPNLLITNLDNSIEKIYRLGTNTQIRHFDTTSRPRLLEYYYDPIYMTELYLPSINLMTFPNTIMENLSILELSFNDFREMPNFKNIAPSLTELRITGNNLSRSVNTANYQLNNYLNNTSLKLLEISGCFSDSDTIDLSSFSNLKSLYHSSGYGQNNNRIMQSTGSTHIVDPDVIENYTVRGHRYTTLHNSVQVSNTLINLDLSANTIGGTIVLDSVALVSFRSDYGNRHNVVSVAGKTSLTEYYYRRTSSLDYLSSSDKTVNGKFNGCINLSNIDLYGCRAYGDVADTFSNLPELKNLDIRNTNISGKITDASFDNTDKLENLYIAGGLFDTSVDGPFISQEGISNLQNLKNLYIYGNYNITGSFPNILPLKKLDTIYIENTGFTGNIPNFSTQSQIKVAILRNSKFTGAMPTIINNTLLDLRLDSNNLESSSENKFPYLECANLRNLVLFGNQFSGPITSFAGCMALRQINLSRNQFDSYTKGALATNRFISNIDISNNNLDENSIVVFILDMLENWKLNNRTKVTINFLGNNYNTSNLDNNLEVKSAINFLIGQNWSITY